MYQHKDGVITTERLVLRPFTLADADDVAAMCGTGVLQRTVPLPYPYTKESAVSWISTHEENRRSRTSYDFAVTDKETGKLYGAISLYMRVRNSPTAEMGYWIGEQYWNRGFATEAARAMIEYAFSELWLHRVFSRHYGSNIASGRVMQKAGMKEEGVMRDHLFVNGRYEDSVIYGIVSMDYDTYG